MNVLQLMHLLSDMDPYAEVFLRVREQGSSCNKVTRDGDGLYFQDDAPHEEQKALHRRTDGEGHILPFDGTEEMYIIPAVTNYVYLTDYLN